MKKFRKNYFNTSVTKIILDVSFIENFFNLQNYFQDSHELGIYKNDRLVTNYWIPKKDYHVQMSFSDVTTYTFRDINILVHMPKLPVSFF